MLSYLLRMVWVAQGCPTSRYRIRPRTGKVSTSRIHRFLEAALRRWLMMTTATTSASSSVANCT